MKFKCELNRTNSSCKGWGMALIFRLFHTNSENTRPRTKRADKPHSAFLLSESVSQGKVLGGREGGWSMFARVGGMMLKQKNKFFSFQKHYLFIILLFFFFFFFLSFWGWNWQMPMSCYVLGYYGCFAPRGPYWVGTAASQWPHSSRQCQETVHLWGRLFLAHSRQLCPDPRGPTEPRETRPRLPEQAVTGRKRLCKPCGGLSWPETPT
jgi:hypothetical protein